MRNIYTLPKLSLNKFLLTMMLLVSAHTNAQYCTPSIAVGCSSQDYIQSFSTSGGSTNISNLNTGCQNAATGLNYYLGMVHTTIPGATVNFTVVNGPVFSQGMMMWVDFNIDGDLTDPGEAVWTGGLITNGATVSSSFVVPLTATPGTTRLRIACNYATTAPFAPCGTWTFGEMEDYTFVINAPCSGVPDYYTVDAPNPVCPMKPFTVGLNGKPATDQTYQWSYSDDYGNSWKLYMGPVSLYGSFTDAISKDRMYRCLITCLNSGKSFTTPSKLVQIAPFYYCYCDNAATTAPGLDIGNITLHGLPEGNVRYSNGLATPALVNTTANRTYTSFQYPPNQPLVIYRDSSFRISVTEITSAATMPANSNVAVFIDFNRNGTYEMNEKVLNKAITAASLVQYTESAEFTVPHDAEIGMTGLRAIIGTGKLDSCGNYTGEGEVEDYLIDIRWEPCSTAANPGAVLASDKVLCPDYDYLLTNVDYEQKKSELMRTWEISADSIVWIPADNKVNNDTLMRIFKRQPFYYRVRQTCPRGAKDTTYTEPVSLKAKEGYKCYCYSQSTGGVKDTSDIGGFTLGDYVMNTGGPHLLNPLAKKKRTDHTDEDPLIIYTDSVYKVTVYHTAPSAVHGDAKITVFMDFDNNKEYDIPYERVFTNYSSISNFTIADTFTVPSIVIRDVPTGMRVIINNDLAPNAPSDLACGPYVSGETHDFIVKFVQRFPTGIVNAGSSITDFGLFPNPTNGKFRVQFSSAEELKNLTVTVTNITGQQVYQKAYEHASGNFSQEIDLGNVAKGVYSVELRAEGQRATQKLVVK